MTIAKQLNLKILSFFCIFFISLSLSVMAYSQDASNRKTSKTRNLKKLAADFLASYKLFEEGKKLYRNREYFDAKMKFQEALEKDPGNKNIEKYLKLCNAKSPQATTSEQHKLELQKAISDLQDTIMGSEIKSQEPASKSQGSRVKGQKPEKKSSFIQRTLSSIRRMQQNYLSENVKQKSPSGDDASLEDQKVFSKTEPDGEIDKKEEMAAPENNMPTEDEMRVLKAKRLANRGTKYYLEDKYETAYQHYKEALLSLHAAE